MVILDNIMNLLFLIALGMSGPERYYRGIDRHLKLVEGELCVLLLIWQGPLDACGLVLSLSLHSFVSVY